VVCGDGNDGYGNPAARQPATGMVESAYGRITGTSHSHERMDGVDVTKLRVALDTGASVLAVAPQT
jgi:hypothetical protein